MHKFQADFYGLEVRVVVLGFERPELNYISRGAFGCIHSRESHTSH